MKLYKTSTETLVYAKNTIIKSDCVAIEFYVPSTGNPVEINGVPVPAGAVRTVTQQSPYFDTTQYALSFQSGAGVNECYVTKTILVDQPTAIGLD